MQVGDLVVQKGWEADGVGLVTRLAAVGVLVGPRVRVTVQWPSGEVDMYWSQLEVVSESR